MIADDERGAGTTHRTGNSHLPRDPRRQNQNHDHQPAFQDVVVRKQPLPRCPDHEPAKQDLEGQCQHRTEEADKDNWNIMAFTTYNLG